MKNCPQKAVQLLSFLLVFLLCSCGGSGGSDDNGSNSGSSSAATLAARLRENFVLDVIIPTFTELNNAAQNLENAILALQAAPTEANLAAAQVAWLNSRSPWEKSEASLFGPPDIFGIDPAIDTWPNSQADIEAILASQSSFTVASIAALDPTVKGFHAIEFFLFGPGATRKASELDAKELSFTVALAGDLKLRTADLLNGWTVGIQGQPAYQTEFLNAGNGSVTFPTEQVATETVIRSMMGICTEVADEKIQQPFVSRDPNQVESQYSFNSLNDFADNIRGVGVVFDRSLVELSTLGGSGLEGNIRGQVNAAVEAIGAIPAPFSTAILNPANDAAIQNAQARIRQLRDTLEQQLLPLAAIQ